MQSRDGASPHVESIPGAELLRFAHLFTMHQPLGPLRSTSQCDRDDDGYKMWSASAE